MSSQDLRRRSEVWKKWYRNHPRTPEQKAKKAAQQRSWRKANPELAKKQARERYRRDPEGTRRKVYEWRKRHPEQWALISRREMLKRKYGLTLEAYDELLRKQKGRCALCKSKNPNSKNNVFPVDHDHATGKVRGLLCAPCNYGLGFLKDNVRLLKKAIQYLMQ